MHLAPVAPAAQAPRPPGAERDGWEGLKTLIRARLGWKVEVPQPGQTVVL